MKFYLKVHDRFLIIDDTIYLIGASLKDLGKKLFGFTKMVSITAEEMLSPEPAPRRAIVTLHARWRPETALYYIAPTIVTELLRFFFVLSANSELTYSSEPNLPVRRGKWYLGLKFTKAGTNLAVRRKTLLRARNWQIFPEKIFSSEWSGLSAQILRRRCFMCRIRKMLPYHAPGRLEASFPWATHEQRLSIECFGLVTSHVR